MRLLGYPSEQAFLTDPARVLPTPTVPPARWVHLGSGHRLARPELSARV